MHTHEFVSSAGGNEDLLANVAFDQPTNGKRRIGRPARIANIKSGHELIENLAMFRMREDRLTAEFLDGDPASGTVNRAALTKATLPGQNQCSIAGDPRIGRREKSGRVGDQLSDARVMQHLLTAFFRATL